MAFITPGLDQALFELINQSWRLPALDKLMPLMSSSAFIWGLGIALFLPALRKRPGRQILCLLIILAAVGLADAGTGVLKHTFYRVRPLNALGGVHYMEDGEWRTRAPGFVKENSAGTSYPSAHAANSMAAAFAAMLFWPASRRFIWLLPLLTGYSRIYLGKHYPADVLGGWLFGVFVAGSLYLIVTRLLDRRGVINPRDG